MSIKDLFILRPSLRAQQPKCRRLTAVWLHCEMTSF